MAKPTRYTPEIIEKFYKSGEWLLLSLSDIWDRNASRYPDKEAVVDEKKRVTWRKAKLWIDRLALSLLDMGLQKDDVLVIQLPNCVELVLLRVACEKAGVLCLPILRNLRHREVEYILSRLNARGIIIPWKYRDFDYFAMITELRPRVKSLKNIIVLSDTAPPGAILLKNMLEQPLETEYSQDYLKNKTYQPEEVSLINHTTGTTGSPKFVEYPMAARLRVGRGFAEALKLSENDIICALGSVATGVNSLAYFGAPQTASKVVMLEHFEAEAAFKAIEKEKVTIACGVPAMWAMMVRHPRRQDYDLSSIRLWWSGSAFLPYQLAVEVEQKLGATIVNSFGAVDFGGTTIPDPHDPRETRFIVAGKPKAGTTIKIVNEDGNEVERGEIGEIWGAGPSCASGYYMDPEATWQAWTKDGWFKTGDLGRLDNDENLILVGRKKDIINRGGQNVYPAEIESILVTHPKVAEVAIVAMPDTIMGEKACAYVAPKPGHTFTFNEMEAYLKSKEIAFYKVPERLELIDKLPMVGAETKIDKRALQKDIASKLKAEGRS